MSSAILKVKDVVEELQCGKATAYEVVREIGFRIGKNAGSWRVRREALTKWTEERGGDWQKEKTRVSTSAAASGGTGQTRSRVRAHRRTPKQSPVHANGSKSANAVQLTQVTQPRTKKR